MKRITTYGPTLSMSLLLFCLSLANQVQSDAAKPQTEQALALDKDARVNWLQKNAVGVRSVDPKDEDFRDLMPLRKILRNARIVMLGESSHGDGGTFLAKTRLIKFLHQKMGFDVLVFESGLYDMAKVWESFRQGDHSLDAIRQGVFPAWGGSDQCYPLWDYVAANANAERPLELAGFDSQISGSASRKYLVKELGAFLNEVGINTDFLNHGTPFRARLEDLMGFKYWRGTQIPSITEQDAYFRQLDQLEKEINEKGSDKNDPRTNSWLRRLQMLRTYPKFIWMPRGGNEAMRWQLSAEREKQGADNMLWLANERYRGKKIIVWGATFHLLRNKGQDCANPQTISLRNLCKYNYVTMGQRVWESLGHQVYVLGFTAYGGSRGLMTDGKTDEDAKEWSGPLKQDQDPTIELEELFNAAGFNYAFLDLRSADKHGEWLKTPIRSRPLGNEAELRDWTQALDGMFFIREQQPNTRKTPT